MGCITERDAIWDILWPATGVNEVAIQKCPGGSEAAGKLVLLECRILNVTGGITGLASRKCVGDDEWEDPNVSSCTTVEQIRLGSQIRDVERIVANIISNETRDLTERFDAQLVVNVAVELRIVTNTSSPLVPNDVDETDSTLGSIVK